MGRGKMKYLFFLLITGLLSSAIHVAYAEEELYLTGIVKDVNLKTRTAHIDVKSLNCRGLRTFSIGSSSEYSNFQDLVNQKINFFIDSSVCKRGETYMILPSWRFSK